jgi:hypothetical protein
LFNKASVWSLRESGNASKSETRSITIDLAFGSPENEKLTQLSQTSNLAQQVKKFISSQVPQNGKSETQNSNYFFLPIDLLVN